MTTVKVEWKGADALISMLAQGGSKAVTALGRALREEADDILAKSKMQVPFEEGTLSGSGMVHPASISGSEVVVEITYGGNASAYAAVQHENTTYSHAPGRKSHYLEDPFMDALPGVERNIADRVEAILKGLI